MRGVFGLEGPVMNFITKITYSAYLNILWLACPLSRSALPRPRCFM
jgi:hypothetical protein